TSPTASNAASVLDATSTIGSWSAMVRFTASPHAWMWADSACCSSTSPMTTTLAVGGGQSTLALACASQLELHSALPSQSSCPSHTGGLTSASHSPWQLPWHSAEPSEYTQVPWQVPSQSMPALAEHEPVHCPSQRPPENSPSQAAWQLPVARPS